MTKQPYVDRVWQRGPSLSPAAQLREWLDAQPQRLVRVPVVLVVEMEMLMFLWPMNMLVFMALADVQPNADQHEDQETANKKQHCQAPGVSNSPGRSSAE